jgi:hypothetical protein
LKKQPQSTKKGRTKPKSRKWNRRRRQQPQRRLNQIEPVGLLGGAAADAGRPAGARGSRAREGN